MRAYLLCLLIALFPASIHAAIVQQEMRPGIGASADYMAGASDKPAVLLLHGFLQTRDFHTVASLGRGINDAGYAVLTPTLSLNVPNRSQSLACEAVHKHSLDDDVAEIARWVRWLKSQGHRSVVLFGHSFGSLQLLAYLASKPDPIVKGYVGASLIETQLGQTDRAALIALLDDRVRRGERALYTGSISFCAKYPSTPEGLLSYARWDQTRVLDALKQIRVATKLVMGDADFISGNNWAKVLQHAHTPVVIIKGANHFMDGEHEFDLLEHALGFLASVPPSRPR
ncbi:MAG: alpha/beta hydrolase [Thiobacillus sp.]|nr:alpha/beta hydrolase [Thiobacillus sp.]